MASQTKKNDLKTSTHVILLQVFQLLINLNINMVLINVEENVIASKCTALSFVLLLNLFF
jgi:hypothetical protein